MSIHSEGRPYLALAALGLLAPWGFLGSYLAGGGASVSGFVQAMFANSVSGAVAADLLVSAGVFMVWVCTDGRRIGVPRLWLYPLLTFGLGLSVGLPIYLHCRTRVTTDG